MDAVTDPAMVPDHELCHGSIKLAENLSRPRILKTHRSFDMLPSQIMEKKAKLIYITHNPRDN